MGVSSRHPDYEKHKPTWDLMREFDEGEDAVKGAGETYLPMPSGFTAQSDGGRTYYAAYQARARVPELVSLSAEGMVGLIHSVEWDIEGLDEGSPLAGMWEKATPDGQPLEALAEKITMELLLESRVGLLADVSEEGGDLPYIALYTTEAILNWSETRDLYVLDETRLERGNQVDEFTWEPVERLRVLRLGEPPEEGDDLPGSAQDPQSRDEQLAEDPDKRRLRHPESGGGVYYQQVYEPSENGEEPLPGSTFVPNVKGRTAGDGGGMEVIPFVVANAREVGLKIIKPPLIGVARASKAIYQLDADYRHQLFWTGQETLYGTGITKEEMPKTVGAGVAIALQDTAAKLAYVGPSGVGIEKHKQAIDDAKRDAGIAASQLFDQTDVPDESGKAKKLRYVAQTATLRSVAKASAKALEAALRHCAAFVGVDPETIIVTPDLDFVDVEMTPAEAQPLLLLWQSGAISYETFYALLQRGRIASPERTAEEEQELVDQESPDEALPGADLLGGGAQPGAEGAPPPAAGGLGSERFVETGEGLEVEPLDEELPELDGPDSVTDEELEALFAPELLEGVLG